MSKIQIKDQQQHTLHQGFMLFWNGGQQRKKKPFRVKTVLHLPNKINILKIVYVQSIWCLIGLHDFDKQPN